MPVLDNPRHEAIARGLAQGKSQQDLEADLGYTQGYVSRLLSKKVQIAVRRDELTTKVTEKASVDAAKVLRTLDAIVDADVADIIDPATGAQKPVHEWPVTLRCMVKSIEPAFKRSSDGEHESWDQAGYKVVFERGNLAIKLLGQHVNVKAFQEERHEHLHIHVELEQRLAAGRERVKLLKSEAGE